MLADEPGLGKTAQLIRASVGRTLVVAPSTVLRGHTWTDDLAKFADDPGRFLQAPYSMLNPRKRVGDVSKVVPGAVRPEYNRHWDTLILDEAHYVKNAKTSWTKAVLRLARQSDRVYLATGTPIPNWPSELFVPLQILRPDEAKAGQRLGSYWRWVDEWFATAPNPWNPRARDIKGLKACTKACASRPPYDPCDHYREFVAGNLGDAFLQRRRDDVLTDLPPLTFQRVRCPMVPKQDQIYRSLRQKWFAELDEQRRIVWTAGSRTVALDRCMTSARLAFNEGEDIGNFEELMSSSGKLQRLHYELSRRARPTLVVAHYRDSCLAAVRVATSLDLRVGMIRGGLSSEAVGALVRQFQAGELDVLVGSLETISEGLTLTAADMVILLESSYKPSRNEQVIRRIHRIGQHRPCTVLDLIAVTARDGKTLDTAKRELLAGKTDLQLRTLTAANWKAAAA